MKITVELTLTPSPGWALSLVDDVNHLIPVIIASGLIEYLGANYGEHVIEDIEVGEIREVSP